MSPFGWVYTRHDGCYKLRCWGRGLLVLTPCSGGKIRAILISILSYGYRMEAKLSSRRDHPFIEKTGWQGC